MNENKELFNILNEGKQKNLKYLKRMKNEIY